MQITPNVTTTNGTYAQLESLISSLSLSSNKQVSSTNYTNALKNEGCDSDLIGLVNQQDKVQRQMQILSLISNLLKTIHDMFMAVINNLRLS